MPGVGRRGVRGVVTRFKICGVRQPLDLEAAVAAGASAVGFNFYRPSARYLDLDQAARLARAVPLWVERVALLVDAGADEVAAAARVTGAGTVQLHGRIDPAVWSLPCRIVVGLPCDSDVLERARGLPGAAAILLDAAVPEQHGGTGQLADWELARQVREALDRPVILAGGLTPENVGAAIAAVRPYAVDVASGVEREPGVKDPRRIAAFGEAVRRAP